MQYVNFLNKHTEIKKKVNLCKQFKKYSAMSLMNKTWNLLPDQKLFTIFWLLQVDFFVKHMGIVIHYIDVLQ